VQATVRGETRERLEAACAELGYPFYRVPVVPFSEAMPDDMPEIDGPFVLYGYTTLLLNAFRDPRWRPGVFFDPALFRPSVYLARWGAGRMLNHDARVVTLKEFAGETHPPDSRWFVKPDDDLKRFTGGVMTYAEFREWYAGVEGIGEGGDIGPETTAVVCTPKTFGNEWRLFMVDGKPVASSCYTFGDRSLPLPPELEAFAVAAARDWSPAPAFALDVTVDEHGAPKLIEANCINGSGFYFADTRAIVRALSLWQEAHWNADEINPR
jgi:hypothetical protein